MMRQPEPLIIVFDLQLADLPVQNIDSRLARWIPRRRTTALENARRAVQ